jgi:hypothetical protein
MCITPKALLALPGFESAFFSTATFLIPSVYVRNAESVKASCNLRERVRRLRIRWKRAELICCKACRVVCDSARMNGFNFLEPDLP